MQGNTLFIYGSLCPGMVHHKLIADSVEQIHSAVITASAYRLEVGFPVVVNGGENQVPGYYVQLKENSILWNVLDQFHAFDEAKTEKSLYWRHEVELTIADTQSKITSQVYTFNPQKLPKTASLIADGNWQQNFSDFAPLTSTLTEDEKKYILRIGRATGREIVPYSNLTREMEKRGYLVDKGRRPALTNIGQEIFRYIE